MKKIALLSALVLLFSAALAGADSLKGMSLNGSTGLISIPSGRIGWERTADFGLDFGYHAVGVDQEAAHIPKASVSLFKMLEVGGAYDIQQGTDSNDILLHGKLQLPIQRNTAVAVGGNVQMLKGPEDNAQQIYIAATYPGTFFKMPAETTFVVGKTLDRDGIDFGMGFDLSLFPEVFQGYVHWINDFSNFSYSVQPVGAEAGNRGVFNTGIRIDLAEIPELSRFKFALDALMTDALDSNRSFSLGVAFGVSVQ